MRDVIVFASPRRTDAVEAAREYRAEGYPVTVEQSPFSENWLVLRGGA